MTNIIFKSLQRSRYRWQLLVILILTSVYMLMVVLNTKRFAMLIPSSLLQDKSVFGYFQKNNESQHIVFLKVHKAASTTVMNIMLRFGLSRNLTIMLPRLYNCINEHKSVSKTDILPSITGKYDLVCNHVIYNRKTLESFFPSDTKYVTILREPFDQFVSGFMYYRHVYPIPYLVKVPTASPISEFLQSPLKYEPVNPSNSFTNNRMSVDLGYPETQLKNMTFRDDFIKTLANEFDLVMIAEYFDESVILLKRTLNWAFKEILYISSNTFSTYKKNLNISVNDRYKYRQWANIDHALYQYFYDKFWEKIYNQGNNFFQEVRTFRYLRKTMTEFCIQKNKHQQQVILPATEWNPPITVTKSTCKFMMTGELNLIEDIKKDYMLKFKNKLKAYLSHNSSAVEGYSQTYKNGKP